MKKYLQFSLVITLCAFVAACGATDADKIGEAQACLDKATTSAAAAICASKVDGIETASANGIRCSANFIAEGFGSAAKITTILDQLGGGLNSILSLMTFSSKGNITADNINANDTFQYCLNSGGKGSTLLMAFANVTMSIYAVASAAEPTECPASPSGGAYDFDGCLDMPSIGLGLRLAQLGNSGDNDPSIISAQTAIGNTIIAAHRLSCATGTSANQEMCSYFSNAISNAGGTSNSRAVASEFITVALTP